MWFVEIESPHFHVVKWETDDDEKEEIDKQAGGIFVLVWLLSEDYLLFELYGWV